MKRIAFCVLLLCTANCFTQSPGTPQIQSPVVNSDHTVAFKLSAPIADNVFLSAQFPKAHQLVFNF